MKHLQWTCENKQKQGGLFHVKHFFNEVNVFFGFIGGSLSYLLGGFDYLLQFLVLLMVIDFVTGFAKSFFNHNLDKEKIFVGAYKKVAMFLVVIIAQEIDMLTNGQTPTDKTATIRPTARQRILSRSGRLVNQTS